MKRIYLFSLCFVLIISFGIFIYPGLYKYDKFNQKYPVKINRLTGQTQILSVNGWADVGGYDSAADKMEQYKNEISELLSVQNEKIKNDVLSSIRVELDSIKESYISNSEASEFDGVRNRNKIPNEINSSLESNEFFEKGDSPDRVQEVMGTPDSIIGGELHEIWKYGNSSVTFSNGTVNGWSNRDNNLKLK